MNHRLTIDSAGIGGWHVGSLPDPRSIDIAKRHGIDLTDQTCRRLVASDFDEFDLILAMDNSNIANARAIEQNTNGENVPAQIDLFIQYAGLGSGSDNNLEIPDPYFGGPDGFEISYQLIKQASIGTLDRLFG